MLRDKTDYIVASQPLAGSVSISPTLKEILSQCLVSIIAVLILLEATNPTSLIPPPVLVPLSCGLHTPPIHECRGHLSHRFAYLGLFSHCRHQRSYGPCHDARHRERCFTSCSNSFVVLVAAENAAESIVAVMAV